jgi:hypothetical protein
MQGLLQFWRRNGSLATMMLRLSSVSSTSFCLETTAA